MTSLYIPGRGDVDFRSLSVDKAVNKYYERLFFARNEDTEASDLDILVDTQPNTSLLDIAKLQLSLEKKLGIHVDVLTPKSLPESFRNQVVLNAIPI